MKTYIQMLKDAEKESASLFEPEFRSPIQIDENISYPEAEIRDVIAERLKKDFASYSYELTGECFKAACYASEYIHDLGIQHAITIGNVIYENEPYYKASLDSILDEIAIGYAPVPAVAHCWLTLNSGQIIDLTILASIAHNRKKVQHSIGIKKSIFVGEEGKVNNISHHPYLTGFGYHLRVVTHPQYAPDGFERYSKWAYMHQGIEEYLREQNNKGID